MGGGSDGSSSIGSSTYLNQFHHIVATHDGTNRKIYVNGQEKLSFSANTAGLNSGELARAIISPL